jgi:hypothetical protein
LPLCTCTGNQIIGKADEDIVQHLGSGLTNGRFIGAHHRHVNLVFIFLVQFITLCLSANMLETLNRIFLGLPVFFYYLGLIVQPFFKGR